jgi:hypothetical protein
MSTRGYVVEKPLASAQWFLRNPRWREKENDRQGAANKGQKRAMGTKKMDLIVEEPRFHLDLRIRAFWGISVVRK